MPARMKNKKSIYLIVMISLFVALLHLIIGPDYQGICRHFIRGYLIDILLPMNLYLLLQISLRKRLSVYRSRVTGAVLTFSFGIMVELLQFYGIHFLGSTYDPLDILMYGTGVASGILIDLVIINKLEKKGWDKE